MDDSANWLVWFGWMEVFLLLAWSVAAAIGCLFWFFFVLAQ